MGGKLQIAKYMILCVVVCIYICICIYVLLTNTCNGDKYIECVSTVTSTFPLCISIFYIVVLVILHIYLCMLLLYFLIYIRYSLYIHVLLLLPFLAYDKRNNVYILNAFIVLTHLQFQHSYSF